MWQVDVGGERKQRGVLRMWGWVSSVCSVGDGVGCKSAFGTARSTRIGCVDKADLTPVICGGLGLPLTEAVMLLPFRTRRGPLLPLLFFA
jgi:hypothetical protein